MDLGSKVRAAREKKGISQETLASRVGISQASADKIERGKTKHSRHLVAIFHVLEMPLSEMEGLYTTSGSTMNFTGELHMPDAPTPVQTAMPVFATQDNRDGGVDVRPDPIDYIKRPETLAFVNDAYGLLASDLTMYPAVMAGDLLLVHPHLTPRHGDTVVMYQQSTGDGRALIRMYCGHDEAEWVLRRFNPKIVDTKMPRDEWQVCHVVVGRFSRT